MIVKNLLQSMLTQHGFQKNLMSFSIKLLIGVKKLNSLTKALQQVYIAKYQFFLMFNLASNKLKNIILIFSDVKSTYRIIF